MYVQRAKELHPDRQHASAETGTNRSDKGLTGPTDQGPGCTNTKGGVRGRSQGFAGATAQVSEVTEVTFAHVLAAYQV